MNFFNKNGIIPYINAHDTYYCFYACSETIC